MSSPTETFDSEKPQAVVTAPSEAAYWLTLGGIVLLAIVLRVFAVERQSIWYDEAFTIKIIQNDYSEILSGRVRDNGNPPLYWVLAKAWATVGGRTEFGYRSLSVLLSVLTVPAVSALGRKLLSAWAGLFAAFLLAISPFAIELGNEARTFALLQLLAVASTGVFVAWRSQPSIGKLLCYAALVFLMGYSHYYAFAVPMAHGVSLLFGAEGRRKIAPFMLAIGLAAAAYLVWLPVFVQQLTTPSNLSRYGDSWMTQFAATPLALAFGRTFAWRDSSRALLAAGSLIGLVAFVAPAVGGIFAARYESKTRALLAGWWLAPIVVPFAACLLGVPMYGVRYATIGLPGFLLLVAAGSERLSRPVRLLQLAMILGATSVSLYNYAQFPLKDDWRSAERIVGESQREGELVVLDPEYEALPYLYYAKRENRVPATIVGVVARPSVADGLIGTIFAKGVLQEPVETRCDAVLDDHPGIWLLLCQPTGSIDDYQQILAARGYAYDRAWNVAPRTQIHHFVRPGSARAQSSLAE